MKNPLRLGRLAIYYAPKAAPIYDYNYSSCQCHILEVWKFTVEWLSPSCKNPEEW